MRRWLADFAQGLGGEVATVVYRARGVVVSMAQRVQTIANCSKNGAMLEVVRRHAVDVYIALIKSTAAQRTHGRSKLGMRAAILKAWCKKLAIRCESP